MVAISSILGAFTALPQIVAGVESVIGSLSGAGGAAALPITAAQQSVLSGGFGGPTTSTGTSVGPGIVFGQPVEAGIGGAAVAVARRALPIIVGGALGEVVGGAGSSMLLGPAPPARGGAMTRKQMILAQARAFSPGATAKKIIRSARQCGIELAAATFGLAVLDVCFLIAQPPTRRRRGISAADLRRTRSTIRKVANIQRDLGSLARRSPARRK